MSMNMTGLHALMAPPPGQPAQLMLQGDSAANHQLRQTAMLQSLPNQRSTQRSRPQTASTSKGSKSDAAEDLPPDALTACDDAFRETLKGVAEEHKNQVDELKKTIEDLRGHLNLVLQATWNMHGNDNGVHGQSDFPDETALLLRTQDREQMAKSNGKVTSYTEYSAPAEEPEQRRDRMISKPRVFSLLDRWENFSGGLDKIILERRGSLFANDAPHRTASEMEAREGAKPETADDYIEYGDGFRSRFIVFPHSSKRLAWDVFGLFLLCYDIVMVPLGAFNLEETTIIMTMDWFTLFFWTFDMVASLFTGYVWEGRTIMQPEKIFTHYLKTWFCLDVLVVVPDWIFTIMGIADEDLRSQKGGGGEKGKSSDSLRLLRIFRMARGLRLLRLAKLRRIVTIIKDSVQSELVFAFFNCLGIILLLVAANHAFCSLWYAIGELASEDEEDNWIDAVRINGEPLFYRYIISLHWSISCFTMGSAGRVYSVNNQERIFSILLQILGMVFLASLTSYLTLSFLQARDFQKETSKHQWVLRRYLRQNGVSPTLKYRVMRYAEFACSSQRVRLNDSNVELLGLLSDGLRTELRFEVHFAEILVHPLFEEAARLGELTIHGLAASALTDTTYAPGEGAFKAGVVAHNMYTVTKGELVYEYPRIPDFKRMEEKIAVDSFVCEQALWVRWTTYGRAYAEAPCTVITLDSMSFCTSIQKDVELWEVCHAYAQKYVSWLNELDHTEIADVNRQPELLRNLVNQSLAEFRKFEEPSSPKEKGSPSNRLSAYPRLPQKAWGPLS